MNLVHPVEGNIGISQETDRRNALDAKDRGEPEVFESEADGFGMRARADIRCRSIKFGRGATVEGKGVQLW